MRRPSVEAGPSVVIEKRWVVPPAVMAQRMQRYSLAFIIISFLLVGLNWATVTLPIVLWVAAGLAAMFALMCAITVVILHAVAWNFDRLRTELHGGPGATDMK